MGIFNQLEVEKKEEEQTINVGGQQMPVEEYDHIHDDEPEVDMAEDWEDAN